MATIEFVNVTKSYPGAASPAVNDVSFTVREGAICMLLGTSGSGKTTLLRMVNRLIDPTSGEIRIDGTPTTAQDPITLRRGIGYVIQQVGLFPHLSIEDNVRVVPSILGEKKAETAARVDELLRLVGLEPEEYRRRYPRQLSGGQQQRVGLARALANDPAILLFDEPFSALDPLIRRDMQDEVVRLQEELHKTVVFITHDLQEALKLGDRIAIMRDGRFVQVGTPEEVVAQPADEYVRDFVRDVPRGHVLTARAIMGPVEDAALSTVHVAAGTRVSDLVPIVAATDDAVAVLDDDGQPCGSLDRVMVLNALADAPVRPRAGYR
jgi:osmoprotectant transport system ATP-binding protein